MSVVVIMGLPQVFRLDVGVRLVIVFQGGVVVLVGMSGGHVFPFGAMAKVVDDVRVLVDVDDRAMGVVHDFLPGLS